MDAIVTIANTYNERIQHWFAMLLTRCVVIPNFNRSTEKFFIHFTSVAMVMWSIEFFSFFVLAAEEKN